MVLYKRLHFDQYGDIDPVIERKFLLEIGNNFILVTKSDTVKFAHRSAREFLVQSLLRNSQREAITLRSAHAQASETCLAFLISLKDDSKWGNLRTDGREDAKGLNLSSFEMYACFFLGIALRKGRSQVELWKRPADSDDVLWDGCSGKGWPCASYSLSKMDQSLVASFEYKSSFRRADTIASTRCYLVSAAPIIHCVYLGLRKPCLGAHQCA